MAAQSGVIIPIQSTDAGKAQIKESVDNLGQQVSACVQSYNDLRGKIEGEASSDETKAKFRALADQRRAALEQIKLSYVSARQQAESQGIQPAPMPPVQLAGLGADSLGGLQTAVSTEQSKLALLAAYYESYKAAVAAGTQPPAVPTELQNGVMGISAGTLAMFAAIAAAAYFMFFNKN